MRRSLPLRVGKADDLTRLPGGRTLEQSGQVRGAPATAFCGARASDLLERPGRYPAALSFRAEPRGRSMKSE